ncbi:cellulase family glycosylhydrolase [Streptomyces acidiscabies]|uniref:Cellulase family glycosylhydrolase n=1 Tax=Streptomyces acidiscabies TaxID=42234 RepID=A0AAP6EIA7_9ACTN|nr:cellulase family glycosylhydrolase [Streptomyces acidiscabies]MBP5941864.1 cellulase family glycosylhydrolase [Streptomyces sp. LBUM 1476]MBZ3913298.1 cellulase family glycosylhydrolase [Streptomyces acidiscabies]MDX2963276.1 cellulase family glycosylhydrolase [Streptomyces acidiscabies]MDX3021506.1 cellulase family glycosylhydrolase [Streptomyces acidiscabies]MDX3790265.1 cellulase family glycosylhydrolase [Streptomyces acidiscabies]
MANFLRRRTLSRLAALLLALLLLPLLPATTAHAADPPPPASAAARSAVAAMQPGWNLGNTYDAIPDETSWGNPPVTRALLQQVKSQGFRSIRLPVTWSGHQGGAPGYTIDPVWLGKVRQVVDWALDENLYVLLNLHHDSWMWLNTLPTDHDNVLARYTATWTQIAAAFRDRSPKLAFESVNEPTFTDTSGDEQSYRLLAELNRAFHTAVRASGGGNTNRLLVLPTLYTNSDQGRLDALTAELTALRDPMIATTIHFYGWWPFSVNIAGYTRFDATSEQDLTGSFDRAYNAFTAHGVPVIVGEYALLAYDHTRPGIIERGEVRKYFEYLGNYARERRLTTMLWDAGQFLNRNTLQWRDPELFAQIKSSWTTRSGTASTDQVFLPKSAQITAQTITLNPNTTTFQGLRAGSRNLLQGRDYTLSGNQLTLTATALTELAGNRAYGLNATLQARFSRGVPWRIDIVTYDTPVLSNSSGNTSGLSIPTQFRGDQLATMEARYDDGTNAGPANWTPYQQWDSAFTAYTADSIKLTADFTNSLRDNARATLTFHFWSGTTVTYHVVKTGGVVTGTV